MKLFAEICVMEKKSLTKDSQFTVGEEKWLNYILGILCLALFIYGVVDAAKRNFKNIDYQSYVFALAIVPVIYFFKKANSKRVFIRVNKIGIYQDEKLVTKWSNLLKAYVAQKEKKGIFNIQDNFELVLEFKAENGRDGIRKKIPLTNTQNKSDEDVLTAVQFFWWLHRKEAGNYT